MSETRLEKYKKYRQSLNEFKSINNEPDSVKYRDNSIVSDKMNTTSTLPLEEVLGKIDDREEIVSTRILNAKRIKIALLIIVGILIIAGAIIFAMIAFGGNN